MTTNTNPSRTTARFAASTAPRVDGTYAIIDRTDGNAVVATIKGRAAARTIAATLTSIDPAPRTDDDVKPAAKRTSHADCDHASSKLARAICRREARKANA